MCKACSPGGIPLSESLSSTPAGVCSRETVPTSWRFVSLSSALADWAAAGRTSAVANKAITLMVRVHFRKFMPWSPRRQSVDSNYFLHGLPHLACRALLLSGDSARGWFRVRSARRYPRLILRAGTAAPPRLGTFASAASVLLFRWRNCFLLEFQRGGLKSLLHAFLVVNSDADHLTSLDGTNGHRWTA